MGRRGLLLLLVAAVAGGLAIADRMGLLGRVYSGDFQQYHNATFRVAKVVDGDTIDVDIPDRVGGHATTRIRLWGVDTPYTSLNVAIRSAFWAKFRAA